MCQTCIPPAVQEIPLTVPPPLRTAWKAIYWIVWPIAVLVYWLLYYLAFAVLFLLKLVYRPLEFILLPVIYFAQFLFACLLAPFQVLAKFEV